MKHMTTFQSNNRSLGSQIQRPRITRMVPQCALRKSEMSCTSKNGSHNEDSSMRAKNGAIAFVLSATLGMSQPAFAELNKYEAAAGGEFNVGSALQYGEADIKGKDFHGQNADISDMLMDRAVLNDANLKNANLQRTVLTRSDLTGADIEGADFTNALVDKPQQMALCKYASGTNPDTGADTRKSLGCGSRRAFRASQPSSTEGPQVEESSKEAFRKTMPTYRQ